MTRSRDLSLEELPNGYGEARQDIGQGEIVAVGKAPRNILGFAVDRGGFNGRIEHYDHANAGPQYSHILI